MFVQQLLRHAEGFIGCIRGADVGNVDASRSNARVLNNDATKHQGYVRVVMGFGTKGMENMFGL